MTKVKLIQNRLYLSMVLKPKITVKIRMMLKIKSKLISYLIAQWNQIPRTIPKLKEQYLCQQLLGGIPIEINTIRFRLRIPSAVS